ncbi:hypothetical protein Ahy_A08g037793 isoform B [Arachis hypogaea]|uniref:Methyltransferase n=1 Tax=Arachis hypogaea TaxID=3818 RepID=A0A445BRU0_ARAHY|nr:hypothetical protein Ahy_A08g037793 isoform B [Arachis hypogaea]
MPVQQLKVPQIEAHLMTANSQAELNPRHFSAPSLLAYITSQSFTNFRGGCGDCRWALHLNQLSIRLGSQILEPRLTSLQNNSNLMEASPYRGNDLHVGNGQACDKVKAVQSDWGGEFGVKISAARRQSETDQKIEDLASSICWKLVKKEGYIAIWQKPMNNSCYHSRDNAVHPPLCESNDDPDDVWYVGLKACITQLPSNGYGANVSKWPARLHQPPDRLQSIKHDASLSRKELFHAESKYWNEIIDSYVRVFLWKEYNLRNVMDMRAGFGGFAAALHDLQIDCWVINVVPVNGFNTLPILYDRGLIGVMHDCGLKVYKRKKFRGSLSLVRNQNVGANTAGPSRPSEGIWDAFWQVEDVCTTFAFNYKEESEHLSSYSAQELFFPCLKFKSITDRVAPRNRFGLFYKRCEPFDTYPRTYDLLHASGLFSIEKNRKKCNMSTIMLEMDRMLRPGGHVYIRDTVHVINELDEIATAMGWMNVQNDVGEGPNTSWRILRSEKHF